LFKIFAPFSAVLFFIVVCLLDCSCCSVLQTFS